MQLVADPRLLVALAVSLGADIAGGGEIGEHLSDVLRRLPFETRRLRFWPFLVLARASTLLLGLGAGGRRRRVVLVFLVFIDRLLARLDFGGVARDDANDAAADRAFDERRVHSVGQITLRELGKGVGKGGFGGNLRAPLPTNDPAQRLVDREALDERSRGGNAQHDLGDESPRQGAAILGRPAGGSRWFGNEGLEADHVENSDRP